MTLTRPRAVLLDWDNTLVDSFGVIHTALNETLEAMGRQPRTFEETCRQTAKSMRNAFPALFGERWEEARDIFYRKYSAIHLAQIRPLPGAVELLEALSGTGAYMAVVSNKSGKNLRKEAAHLGWDGYFSRLVGANDAEEDKPAPAAVHLALSGSGVEAGPDVWFVGDNAIDIDCAEAAGCLPILLRGTVATGHAVASGRVEWCFDNRDDFTELVKRL
jgi:phosphoglycolate phosphatase